MINNIYGSVLCRDHVKDRTAEGSIKTGKSNKLRFLAAPQNT